MPHFINLSKMSKVLSNKAHFQELRACHKNYDLDFLPGKKVASIGFLTFLGSGNAVEVAVFSLTFYCHICFCEVLTQDCCENKSDVSRMKSAALLLRLLQAPLTQARPNEKFQVRTRMMPTIIHSYPTGPLLFRKYISS